MIRDAARYGAWAAFLAFVTTAITYTAVYVGGETGFRTSSVITIIAAMSLLAAFAAMLAAFVGWAMLHRRGRRHGLIGYGFLATGVVIIAQLLISLPFVVAEPTPRMIAWASAKDFRYAQLVHHSHRACRDSPVRSLDTASRYSATFSRRPRRLALLSWPQAARMSRPRGVRMGALKPPSFTISAKRCMRLLELHS
jgi:hypothetical protein